VERHECRLNDSWNHDGGIGLIYRHPSVNDPREDWYRGDFDEDGRT
jgi:hypothetical protein